ncbi:hypothetical protein MCAP1_002694 [Malassezia caprae]|uniref:GH16 domain-containing protein n=1 Tax=Malassezia caprae TaxID=1381934 RepID=A0AAF0E9U1_9BASI|nr:hypothetical protein MCAP1_002694 [Malassezia caprae]
MSLQPDEGGRRARPVSGESVDSIMNSYLPPRESTPESVFVMGEALGSTSEHVMPQVDAQRSSLLQRQHTELPPLPIMEPESAAQVPTDFPSAPSTRSQPVLSPSAPWSASTDRSDPNFDMDESYDRSSKALLAHDVSTSHILQDQGSDNEDPVSYYLDKSDGDLADMSRADANILSLSDTRDDMDSIAMPYIHRGPSHRRGDTDSILDQYASDQPAYGVTGTYRRRPTEPDTPTYNRRSMDQLSRRDSAASMGIYSGVDSDEENSMYDTPLHKRASQRAAHKYMGVHGDSSLISLTDPSADPLALSNDYDALAFEDEHEDLQGADREWDERPMRFLQKWSMRGCVNLSMLAFLTLGVLMLFLGYPVLHSYTVETERNSVHFGNVATDKQPFTGAKQNLRTSLIDPDTPLDKHYRQRTRNNKRMKLVFSDEFNKPGRTFYPGDDPFWQAEDLHYWQTENYEWYDPDTVTTEDGDLVIRFMQKPEHGLNFRGGMISGWNRFCFTGGYVEARLVLPGNFNVSGLWPAVWAMGNLGRAGYGASTDGMWPYSYDECDVGTMPNQTWLPSQGGGPLAAESSGRYVDEFGPGLSYLKGQRLSRCTCSDSDDHPGPRHPDGSWVGRSAPEIDMLEATSNNGPGEHGQASMSLQVAPFDAAYNVSDPSAFVVYEDRVHNATKNDYTGAVFQQAVSAKVNTSDTAYQHTGGEYDTYAFEYEPGKSKDSYITWFMSDKPVVDLNATAIGPNKATEVGARLIPEEPMYLIINLGMSSSFVWINWDELMKNFDQPFEMRVDYVRVYQDEDRISEDSLSCDPSHHPTKDYIERHWEAYTNSLLTSWDLPADQGGYNHPIPGNKLMGQCS